MALITCRECGKNVSDQADYCPNCGVPVKKENDKKFCLHCGKQIDKECVICPLCGKQVAEFNAAPREPQIVVNNNNTAFQGYQQMGQPKNKWVSLLLCFFTIFGHKVYEGKYAMAVLYFFTLGLCGIGWLVDLILLIMKPETYYV